MEHQHYGPSALGQHPGGGLLAALPDVDPARLSITGASGKATQAFLLTAVDDRIKASAPVNMISFIHQGGGCQEQRTCVWTPTT